MSSKYLDYFKSPFFKSMEGFNNQTKQSWEKLFDILETAKTDITHRNIEVAVAGSGDVLYKTTIGIDGDIKNEFPKNVQKKMTFIGKDKKLVDEALATRKELSIKVIETIGNTIKEIINPMNIPSLDAVKKNYRNTTKIGCHD
jgi:hypothetical protein